MNAKTIIEDDRETAAAAAVYAEVRLGLVDLARDTAAKTGRKCWVDMEESALYDNAFGRNLVVKIEREEHTENPQTRSRDVWEVEVSVSRSPNSIRAIGRSVSIYGSEGDGGVVVMPAATIYVESLFKRTYCNDENPGIRIAHALEVAEKYLQNFNGITPIHW